MIKRIILVDQDRQTLSELNQLVKGSAYETVCFESAEEAFIYMESNTVDLILSDIRNVVMDGTELLRKVKERYPEVIRVVFGWHKDSYQIYQATEENLAKMYLFKPWDTNSSELPKVIENMFNYEGVLQNKEIVHFINNVEDLPTVPELYKNISAMIQREEDIDKIASLIEEDQATSLKILRIGNSAFFGKKTGSIKQAIMYIGLSNVKNIVLASSVFVTSDELRKSLNELWKHSTLTNRYTNLMFQEHLEKKMPTIFASAGLLHNIGMVVLLRNNSKAYGSFMEKQSIYDETFSDREKSQFGISHQDVGGYLLNWWGLPLPIVESALYHHDPLNENIINKELVQVVHIANIMAWNKIKGTLDEDTRETMVGECCLSLGLDIEQVVAYFDALDAPVDFM